MATSKLQLQGSTVYLAHTTGQYIEHFDWRQAAQRSPLVELDSDVFFKKVLEMVPIGSQGRITFNKQASKFCW
jgi:hypothetical protein